MVPMSNFIAMESNFGELLGQQTKGSGVGDQRHGFTEWLISLLLKDIGEALLSLIRQGKGAKSFPEAHRGGVGVVVSQAEV